MQPKHNLLASRFRSDNIVIDNFIKSEKALDANLGVTYLLIDDDELLGFYNIGVGQINSIVSINGTSYYALMGGAVYINYLALDKGYQHTLLIKDSHFYYGDYLLRKCERKILALRKCIGASFIVVHSTPEGYRLYHDRNDYEDFEEDMNSFVQESDKSCYRLYKCIDDLIL